MTAEQLGPIAYVRAFPLTGKHAVVRTTHELIATHIDTVRRERALHGNDWSRGFYRHIYVQALDHRLQLVDDTEEKKRSWQNFCNDVVLLYAMRYVLFDKLIPVQSGNLPSEPGCYYQVAAKGVAVSVEGH